MVEEHPYVTLRRHKLVVADALGKARRTQKERTNRVAAIMRSLDERRHKIDLYEVELRTVQFCLDLLGKMPKRTVRDREVIIHGTADIVNAAFTSERIAYAQRLSTLRERVSDPLARTILDSVIIDLRRDQDVIIDHAPIPITEPSQGSLGLAEDDEPRDYRRFFTQRFSTAE